MVVILNDLTERITKGTTPSNIGADFSNEGVMYFRSEIIGKGKYVDKTSGLLFISKETHEKLKRSQIQVGDILFSMAGVYLGKVSIVGNDDVPANTNQAVAIIRFKKNACNIEYVYYYMKQKWFNDYVCSFCSQAAQPNINLNQIGRLKIDLPDRMIQDKIVKNISLYDDLIDNNNKRIKILERMAENLYKEWFVRFRFPGYETAEFVDGVPKGWTFKHIEQIGEVVAGGTPSTKFDEYWNGDIPWLTPADLSDFDGIYIRKGSTSISELGLRKSSAVLLPANTVLLSSRAPIGYVALAKNPITTNQGFKSVICNEDVVNYYYLFYFFKMNKSLLESFGSGATFLELSAKGLRRIKVIVPSIYIQNKFGEIINKIANEIDKLQQQNQNLIKQREYLLPRLMSGKLQVK